MDTIREHARDFIAKKEAPAVILNDGKQTPMKGHPVFIAQHATATCCRQCIQKWHKMRPGRVLNHIQQEYLVDGCNHDLDSKGNGQQIIDNKIMANSRIKKKEKKGEERK